MATRAQDREQAERLARAFAASIQREQSVTAAIVAELAGATVKDSLPVGGPSMRTAEQVAADSGMHLVDLDGGAVLLIINGRAYR